MTARKPGPVSFEKALDRLEAIVEKLESEELGLDASLALFEEGINLSKTCQDKLEEVERRVEIVLKNSGAELKTRPFSADAPEDDSREETGQE
jgi:exodeoxyribonuclease VII small subunit